MPVRHLSRGKRYALGGIVGALVMLLALFNTPHPDTWGTSPSETPQSIRLDFTFKRTVFGQYEGRLDSVDARPMTILVWDAVRYNPWFKTCLLCTSDHSAEVTVEGPEGASTLTKDVDGFLLLGDQNQLTLVFTHMLPGTYAVHARLLTEAGMERARVSTSFEIIGT